VDPSRLFADHPAASWVATSGLLSVIGAFLLRFRAIAASVERMRIRTSAQAVTAEIAERALFRSTLVDQMEVVRRMMRDSQSERDALRERVTAAESQILILEAANDIMEQRVAFFRESLLHHHMGWMNPPIEMMSPTPWTSGIEEADTEVPDTKEADESNS
jgi:hypothetical protein